MDVVLGERARIVRGRGNEHGGVSNLEGAGKVNFRASFVHLIIRLIPCFRNYFQINRNILD